MHPSRLRFYFWHSPFPACPYGTHVLFSPYISVYVFSPPPPPSDPLQLCINLVNEMLQEQFTQCVFSAERRLLAAEGIETAEAALASSADRIALMTTLLQV